MCGIPRIGRPLNAFSTRRPSPGSSGSVSIIYLPPQPARLRRVFARHFASWRWPAEIAPCAFEKRFQRNFGFCRLVLVLDCHLGPAWPFIRPSSQRPELRLGYPLNLSILVSGGIETKKDSLSNGERTGKSSRRKSGQFVLTCGV